MFTGLALLLSAGLLRIARTRYCGITILVVAAVYSGGRRLCALLVNNDSLSIMCARERERAWVSNGSARVLMNIEGIRRNYHSSYEFNWRRGRLSGLSLSMGWNYLCHEGDYIY